MKENTGIFWLRNDFRINRNNALSFASNNHYKVSAIYIFKKFDFENKREAQRWWLYKSLSNFKKTLIKYNINLEVIEADTYDSGFKKILKNDNFSIYWNKIYEPNFSDVMKKLKRNWKNKILILRYLKAIL